MKLSELKKLAYQEADMLRKHATKEELDRLDSIHLEPASAQDCIYGQMTGNCENDRSIDLIHKCTPKYIHRDAISEEILDTLETKSITLRSWSRTYIYVSCIESYILKCSRSEREKLANYIKS